MDDINFASGERIADLQNRLLRESLRYLQKHSPYYRSFFREHHISDLDGITIDNIRQIPITGKKELTTYNYDFFCNDISEAADIVSTSGSTSQMPILHPLTRTDLARLAYNEKVSLQKTGLGSSDLVMLATALDGSFVASLAYYLGLKELGTGVIRAGARDFALQSKLLAAYPVTAIIGVPSNILRLYEYCRTNKQDISLKGVSRLILIGEAIRDRNFELNQLGKRLADCFPAAALFSTYANTETCSSFCECSAGSGGHLNPDLAYAEIVDDEGRVLEDGQIGHLVITTFGLEGMPLLRYDTGDITFLKHGKCDCGRSSVRVGPILGRREGIIKINGITLQLAALGEILLGIPEIRDYCIQVEKEENGTAGLWVYYEADDASADMVTRKIKQEIWDATRVSARVRPVSCEQLRSLQYAGGSRKPVRYRDVSYK